MYSAIPSAGVTELIGVAGFFLYVTNYSLLTLRIWSSDELRYFAVNLAAALIQIFFVCMSLTGMMLRLRRGLPPKPGAA